jgi:predicted O-methyltransferase YrrM
VERRGAIKEKGADKSVTRFSWSGAKRGYAETIGNAFGYLKPDEIAALKLLSTCLLSDNPRAVNIGAGPGTSGLALLEGNKDLYLWSIDIEKKARPEGALANELIAFKKAGINPNRYGQIHGDSVRVGQNWRHGKVDLVFIDGCHFYEHTLADIETWLPHIKTGGIMAIHDFAPDPWGAVIDAVHDSSLMNHKCILIQHTTIAFSIGEF